MILGNMWVNIFLFFMNDVKILCVYKVLCKGMGVMLCKYAANRNLCELSLIAFRCIAAGETFVIFHTGQRRSW